MGGKITVAGSEDKGGVADRMGGDRAWDQGEEGGRGVGCRTESVGAGVRTSGAAGVGGANCGMSRVYLYL